MQKNFIKDISNIKNTQDFSEYFKHLTIPNKVLINKILNLLMKRGEKHVSEKILKKTCQLIRISHLNSTFFLKTALHHVKPLVEVKNLKKGSRHKILKAIPIKSSRSYKLAIDWIIQGALKRTERSMSLRLYLEFLNAFQKKGFAIKKKQDLHNQCKQLYFFSKTSK